MVHAAAATYVIHFILIFSPVLFLSYIQAHISMILMFP